MEFTFKLMFIYYYPKCHKNMSTFVHFDRLCNENLDFLAGYELVPA